MMFTIDFPLGCHYRVSFHLMHAIRGIIEIMLDSDASCFIFNMKFVLEDGYKNLFWRALNGKSRFMNICKRYN